MVADDDEDFRVWFRAVLESAPDFELVAEARDGQEAVELAETLQLDLAVVDVRMPEMDGIEVTRRIQVEQPATRVVVASAYQESAAQTLAAAGAGVVYIPKAKLTAETLRQALQVETAPQKGAQGP